MIRIRIFLSLSGVAAALTLMSCMLLPGTADPTRSAVLERTHSESRRYLSSGDYGKALDVYVQLYDKHPEVRKRFADTVEQVRNWADDRLRKKEFAEAGAAYRSLLAKGIMEKDFAGSLSFDEEYLRERISLCSSRLLELGLIKYRDENLDEAIVSWKKALSFDPDNRAVLKAMEIATRQLKKLESFDD